MTIADERTLVFAGITLVISIPSFFWRLFPLIRQIDQDGQIEPKKYSVALGWMIAAFILLFLAAIFWTVQ